MHSTEPIPVALDADDQLIDLTTALLNPHLLVPDTVHSIVAHAGTDEASLQRGLVVLGTVLMLAPKLGRCVPLSFLEQCRQRDKDSDSWQALLMIMLHTEIGNETCQWLQSTWKEGDAAPESLVQHLCQWFPERIDRTVLESISRRSRFSPASMIHLESLTYREQTSPSENRNSKLLSLFADQPRVLVVHNIADRQGDEMVRLYALLQAFLDAFANLEITLFTDRSYLYDHPRLHTVAISDTERFIQSLKEPWDGILQFSEPYLLSNTYNPLVQRLLENHIDAVKPRFFLWARKDINHFVFQSVCLYGQEFASKFGITRRLLPLNYEITMRLILCLGLPLRVGKEQPRAGIIQATNPQPDFAQNWKNLTDRLKANGAGSIAVVNVFGGQYAMKGFTAASFDRLTEILGQLVHEGYGLLLVPNGEGWGGSSAIEAIRDRLMNRRP